MRKLATIALFTMMIAFPVSSVSAQTLPEPDIDDIPVTGGYEIPDAEGSADGDNTNGNGTNKPTTTAVDTQKPFIDGLAAGAAAGIVIGGVLIWFIKPKTK